MVRLIVALDNQHQNEAVIGEDWIRVWPDDFTFIRYLSDDAEVPPFPAVPAQEAEAAAGEPIDAGPAAEQEQPLAPAPAPEPTPPAPQQRQSDLSETGSLYLPRTYGN